MALTIGLTAEDEARLAFAAGELGVSPEHLVLRLVRQHLETVGPMRATPVADEFARALSETVQENEEIYRGLAR